MSIAPPNHTSGAHTSDDWITPLDLIERLGLFDLDPCSSRTQPWPCANTRWTEDDDGLSREWFGQVWLNPPYGRSTATWMEKLAKHGNGVALIFARTETQMFFNHVWPKASTILFLRGRLTFYRPDGTIAPHNSGGPSVLVGYGTSSLLRLEALSGTGPQSLGHQVILK